MFSFDIKNTLLVISLVISILTYKGLFSFIPAIVIIPCFYLGKKFYQQVTERYQLTLISAITLILVGIFSLLLVFSLFSIGPQYKGSNWIYLLTVPIFLALAIATLNIWEMAKKYTIWNMKKQTENQRMEIQRKLHSVGESIHQKYKEIELLEGQYNSLLQSRQKMENRLKLICTASGDQRPLLLQKEALEKSLIRYSEAELKARLDHLHSMADPTAESEIEIWLLRIRLTDLQIDHTHARKRHFHEELRELELLKSQYIENLLTLKQQVRDAQAALDAAQDQRIILD